MRAFFLLLAFVLPVASAFAAFQGPGGAPEVVLAAQVSKAPDDAPCVLEGNIMEKKAGSDDDYLFHDKSGQVIVEIDAHLFAGRPVTPSTVVRLHGKVDAKTVRANEVDVKAMEIIMP